MSEQQSDEFEVIHRSWAKFERQSQKAGLREGVSEGRDSTFQQDFDKGFARGFRSGFVIGQYKGSLRARSEQDPGNIPTAEDPLLANSKRGWCTICSNSDLQNASAAKMTETQAAVFSENLQKLHRLYGEKCNVALPRDSSDVT